MIIAFPIMRIIGHIDMDSFFASVEGRENPQYQGLGIVVGADPKSGIGRGVVSTANYQARKYGIHSAQPISTAWRLAQSALLKKDPKTVFLPVNMSFYEKVSDKIFGIVRKYVPVVEQSSIDEAYLDLSFCFSDHTSRNFMTDASDRFYLSSKIVERGYDSAFELMKKIKKEIKDQEKLTASVGIGPNKLIAKMASASRKPDGLVVVKPDEVEKFLGPLPIGDIPGIGPKSEEFFHSKNIYKVADLKEIPLEQLKSWMGPPATLRVAKRAGKWGEDIYFKVRGLDDSPVTPQREIKSISEQETFDVDTISAAKLLEKLQKLAERVIERMQRAGIKSYKTVTIVVRFSDFTTKNRAHTLSNMASDFPTLKMESLKLFLPFLDRRENPNLKLIRLIGVGIENFDGEGNPTKAKEPKKEKFTQTDLFWSFLKLQSNK